MLQKSLLSSYVLNTLFLLSLSLISTLSFAQETKIQLKVSDKVTGNALFYPGEADKPNIVILHGFMLTHSFHTVKRLAESLNESGYPVLTPTLSLGINKRKESLKCEAIHTHSVDKDIAELDLWIQWLQKKSDKPVILIGHSTGSLLTVWYAANPNISQLQHLIFLSMPDFGPARYTHETEEYADKARKLQAAGDKSLHEFGLSYCKKYITTAENFLSYYSLSKENTINHLRSLKYPKTLIFGTEDKRVDTTWNQELAKLDMNVITIQSANHFFDYEHEFDLLDAIESILSNL